MTATTAAKRLGLILHLICTLLAFLLIGFGIFLLYNFNEVESGARDGYTYIGIGIGALIIYLFGCFGALRENVCLTVTYIVLLCIVVLAQAFLVCSLSYHANTTAARIANSMETVWEEEIKNPGAMIKYETSFDCCGRGSPQDYIVLDRLPPASCFRGGDITKSENIITEGCRFKFENHWSSILHIFSIFGWILIGAEIIAGTIACCLCINLRNDHRRANY